MKAFYTATSHTGRTVSWGHEMEERRAGQRKGKGAIDDGVLMSLLL
jgi:hypothetical protein